MKVSSPIQRVVITCGPTREPIDPVRFITNRSTGTMGMELARAFLAKNYQVTLIAGPVEVPKEIQKCVKLIRFETAIQLQKAISQEFKSCDILCMCAAVADFRVKKAAPAKIKRHTGGMTVRLVSNPDILAGLGKIRNKKQVLIGFSVESSKMNANSTQKMQKKHLNLLAAQIVGGKENPFGDQRMKTTLFFENGDAKSLGEVTKKSLARQIVLEAKKSLRRHLTE